MGVHRTDGAVEGFVARQAARYWWAVAVSGVLWLVVAWVVLRMDVRSLAAVGVLIGVVLLMTAVNEAAVGRMVTGGWRFLHYGMAGAFALAALWSFVRPVDSFFALASVLGLVLVLSGVFEIVRALGSRGENPFWGMGLATGALLLLLAIWVSASDRDFTLAKRSSLILLWVGFMALFRGISQIGLAFGVRRLGHLADEQEPVAEDGGAAEPSVPRQQARGQEAVRSDPATSV